MWGRLDGAERLASIVLNDKMLYDGPLRQKTLEHITKSIQNTILSENRQWLDMLLFERSNTKVTDATRYDAMSDYTVNRVLPQTGVSQTATRALAVLQGVIHQPGKVGFFLGFLASLLYLLVRRPLDLAGLTLVAGSKFRSRLMAAIVVPPFLFAGFTLIFILTGWSLPTAIGATIFITVAAALVAGFLIRKTIYKLATGT
jgi:hypothetical protein